jgi:hypothetical protein
MSADCFTQSLTRGFAAVGEPNVAVCVCPDTELAFEIICSASVQPDREVQGV